MPGRLITAGSSIALLLFSQVYALKCLFRMMVLSLTLKPNATDVIAEMEHFEIGYSVSRSLVLQRGVDTGGTR